MIYHLDTIPVWEAMEKETPCPFCSLYERMEQQEVERSLGGSVMEPDTRIRVNETGICARHHQQLFGMQNRLGHALLTDSHSKELLKKLEKKGFVTCRTSEKDHRCKVVSATERAHELHHAIGVFDDRVFTALCRGLSEGEVAEFLRITDVMLENAKNMNDAREPFPCGRGCGAE